MVRTLIGGATLIGAIAWVSSALAAANGPAQTGYNGVQNVQHQVASGVAGSATLPFTGLSLALIVAVAVLLLVTGIVLRRASRRSTQ
jgi:hypothetical protein